MTEETKLTQEEIEEYLIWLENNNAEDEYFIPERNT
jgi:hypothetical protein